MKTKTDKDSKQMSRKEGRLQDLLGELKKGTLDPALKAAQKAKEDAQKFADQLIDDARSQKEKMIADAEAEIVKKKAVFKKALESAKQQAVDRLRTEVESGIFNPEIGAILGEVSNDLKIVTEAVEVMVKAAGLEVESDEFKAFVSTKVSSEEVAKGLAKSVMKRLDGKVHPLKSLKGGAQLRVEKEHMILDLSSEVIEDLISTYMRAELRGLLFGEELGKKLKG